MAMQTSQGSDVCMRSKRKAFTHLILLNVGRLITYVMAGLMFSTIGYVTLANMNLVNHAQWMRIVSGCMIFVIGAYLCFGNRRPFQFLEPLGAKLWSWVSSFIDHQGSRGLRSLVSGMAWGFLPCGLVYSVLFASLFSSGMGASMMIMLGFGLGTMPSLLLTGMVYKHFREFFHQRSVQRAGGLFFMSGGLLILSAPYWVSTSFLSSYPEMLNVAFCIN